ncbi:Mur ligase family protein, partial [Acinetobacter baumannii]
KAGGTAVLNADDPWVIGMRELYAGSVLTFALSEAADIMAERIERVRLDLVRFRLRTPLGAAEATLPLPGRHNLTNAL